MSLEVREWENLGLRRTPSLISSWAQAGHSALQFTAVALNLYSSRF